MALDPKTLTNYPELTDSGYDPITGLLTGVQNANFRNILDFSDKEGDPDPILYFLLASDVQSLQGAVFTLEEILGLDPHLTTVGGETTVTVGQRLDSLESGTVLDGRYDARYGGNPNTSVNGATWAAVYAGAPGDRSKLTVLGHRHDGVYNAKVDLTTQVTGLLPAANINLTQLTGGSIFSTSGGSTLISTELSHCLRDNLTSVQTLAGGLDLGGSLNTPMLHELNVVDSLYSGINATADTAAWTGYSLQMASIDANSIVYAKTMDLRYWRYSIGIRSRVSSAVGITPIALVTIKNATTGVTIKSFAITPSLYQTTGYEVVYTDFSFNGTRPQDQIQVVINWTGNGAGITWKADSISIVPIHLAAYSVKE